MIDFLVGKENKPIIIPDMCKCFECDGVFKVNKCPTEGEHDEWTGEYIKIPICPVCKDGGCIDDYWCSDENIDKLGE